MTTAAERELLKTVDELRRQILELQGGNRDFSSYPVGTAVEFTSTTTGSKFLMVKQSDDKWLEVIKSQGSGEFRATTVNTNKCLDDLASASWWRFKVLTKGD